MKLQTLESAQNSPKIIKKIIRINVPVFINSNGNKILLPEPHKKLNYYMKLTEENKKHIFAHGFAREAATGGFVCYILSSANSGVYYSHCHVMNI